MSTVAAFIVSAGLAFNVEQTQDTALAGEVAAYAGDQATPESSTVALRTDDVTLSERNPGEAATFAAAKFVDASEINPPDAAAPVAQHVAISPESLLQSILNFAKEMPGQLGTTNDLLDPGLSAANVKPVAAVFDGFLDPAAQTFRVSSTIATGVKSVKDSAADHHGTSQSAGTHSGLSDTVNIKGGDSASMNGAFLESASMKLISEAFGSASSVKLVLPVDVLPSDVADVVAHGMSISNPGDALDFLHQHHDQLSITTADVADAKSVPAVASPDPLHVAKPAAAFDTDVSLVMALGQEVASMSGDAFAHFLGSFLNQVANVELLVSSDSLVFANAEILNKLDSGAVSIGVHFHDGSSISVVGQPGVLLDLIEMI